MSKNRKKFQIANPQDQLDKFKIDKYKIGENGVSFYDIRDMKPVFAFDYLSIKFSNLCYNSNSLKVEDYLGFLTALKTNSQFTYNELRTKKNYRFHPIDFDSDNVSINRKDFKKVLSFKPDEIKDEELPTLYQFDLHYHQKARACGFLYKGIFYLVWFDRNHIIYPGNR
ncbi:hypothetical protein [Halpernia frigidisoli]|uniref:Uncharacterized protein n=1 Tax=Halpernia frigidisoli TaxID=1125876 RepID=A0A1I3GYC0_9FLAO|nr:hypothetical protein [Halpernia frigidisoli]SFI28525.1 hypothetical protein SAMN05443292_2095 [Halpernia frigidisoli]